MALFDNALAEMGTSQTLNPRSFIEYAKSAGFVAANTASAISVQSLQDLAPELRGAGVMCFRLGRYPGMKGTSFALARHTGSWGDYFFLDNDLFSSFICKDIDADRYSLRIFDILPKATESSLVNLAVASGILGAALKLDSLSAFIVHATVQGTYTFNFRPHQALDVVWRHNSGQVEIDGAFVAKRNGIETVFVVEAKVSTYLESLAKHKIVYPILALRESIPSQLPIVGVYMRVLRKKHRLEFYIAEAHFSGGTYEVASLAAIPAGAYCFNCV